MVFPDDTLLRRALGANLAFSAASAGLLALGASPLARFLGEVPEAALYGIAAVLALFAVDLAVQLRGEPLNPLRAFGATVGDLLWVAGSAGLLLLEPGILTPPGRLVVVGVAVAVLALAALQLQGLRRYARNRRGRTGLPSTFVLIRRLDAPAPRVWSLLRQLERIGEFYDALYEVRVEERDGAPVRTCTDRGGRTWSEEVTTLDDGERRLAVHFVTEAEDFPFPMTAMVGGWRVRPAGAGSEVTLWYEFSMPGGPAGEITAALLAPVLERRMTPVVDALGRRAAATQEEEPARPSDGPGVRGR